MLHFCTPWKRQKIEGFLTFLGGTKCNIKRIWVNMVRRRAGLSYFFLLCLFCYSEFNVRIYISTDIKEVIYIRAVAPRGGEGISVPPQILKPEWILKSFQLSFKVSESLKLFIFPCEALFLVKIPKILVQLCEQKFLCYFNPVIGKNNATALYIYNLLADIKHKVESD